MPRYKYTQESGADFKVVDPDKADGQEDTNQVRQVLDDLGNLLGHSKRDDLYPKDGTTGGKLAIPESQLNISNIVFCSDYDHPDDAITAIGASNKTLIVTEAETCDTNFTVPANVTVRFERGGKWTINTGITVTFNGQIDAGLWQIFEYVGTGVLAGTPKVKEVYPQWFGATGDGTTDDTIAIQDTIDFLSNGGTLFFPKGNYLVSNTFTISNRINIIGYGNESQIYQSADLNLFVLDGIKNVTMKNLYLGSSATSDTAIIKLDNAHRNQFEDITLAGGYKGIWVYGSLINTFINIKSYINFGGFFHAVSSNQYWIYSERDIAGTISSNANTYVAPCLEGGVYGFYITDTNNEGNFFVYGGVVEGMSTKGIYTSGIGLSSIVSGTCFEGAGSVIDVSGMILLTSIVGDTVILDGEHSALTDSYISTSVTIDATAKNCRIINVKTVSLINNADGTYISGIINPASEYSFKAGNLQSNLSNLCDGDLENWVSGIPEGFTKLMGDLTKTGTGLGDTTKKFSKYACKIAVATGDTWGNMQKSINYSRYVGKKITVSAWVYSPTSGGAIPKIVLWYDDGARATILDSSTVKDSWVRLSGTFIVRSGYSDLKIMFCAGYNDASPTNYVYVDGIEIIEGQSQGYLYLPSVNEHLRMNLTGFFPHKLSAFAATTSAEFAGVISDKTGTLKLVFADSPIFTTQITTPKVTSAGALTITSAENGDITITPNGAGQVKLGGIVEYTLQSGCRVYNATVWQFVPNNVWTKVIWKDEEFDNQNEFDSTYITGTATATSASHLIDTGNNQFSAGDVGRTVFNTTDNTYAIVITYNSTSDLTLDTDIMADGECYGIHLSRFTATKDGMYLIVGQSTFTDVVTDKLFQAAVKVNGNFKSFSPVHSSNTENIAPVFSVPLKLFADDYVELYVIQNTGNVIRIYPGSSASNFTIIKLF